MRVVLTTVFLFTQAYDGHMNLILSDVEETIMIVDDAEAAPVGKAAINVRASTVPCLRS